MLYLHAGSLSPDPTYGHRIGKSAGNWTEVELFPHELLRASPLSPLLTRWSRSLDLFKYPGELLLKADSNNRAELILDFGTEVDGQLNVEVRTDCPVNLIACFGESEPEASGLVPGHHPDPTFYWHVGQGTQRIVSETRGFRFVRLIFCDVRKELSLCRVSTTARFSFRERDGDFQCSDKRFQRVWQSSVYTARLCAKENTIWDGIKRDRVGWYGDARIIKMALDNVFFDPCPAEAMLESMPTDRWANNIPNYSFDGIAMLRQHILFYGKNRPCVRPCYERALELMDWVRRTQTNEDGFIIRSDHPYFGDMGFLDWSDFPSGGRFEELSWLQCKYLEALRNMREVALILGDNKSVAMLSPRIKILELLIVKRFWDARKGFIHTLNQVSPPASETMKEGWSVSDLTNHPAFGVHYRKTYLDKEQLGPSGPSRQCNALAVFAGLATPAMRKKILRHVFDNSNVSSLCTAYFLYYEQMARGLCGDPAGAVINFRDQVGLLLEREQAATLWERHSPDLTDIRKYFGPNWEWPYSLCHGWGAGAVPVAMRFLLGVEPIEPAFGMVALRPCTGLSWTFSAKIPTPHGCIRISREKEGDPVLYRIPKDIALAAETLVRAGVDFHVSIEG